MFLMCVCSKKSTPPKPWLEIAQNDLNKSNHCDLNSKSKSQMRLSFLVPHWWCWKTKWKRQGLLPVSVDPKESPPQNHGSHVTAGMPTNLAVVVFMHWSTKWQHNLCTMISQILWLSQPCCIWVWVNHKMINLVWWGCMQLSTTTTCKSHKKFLHNEQQGEMKMSVFQRGQLGLKMTHHHCFNKQKFVSNVVVSHDDHVVFHQHK